MKTRQLFVALVFLTGLTGKAQVKDISFTLSPAAEYTWWDDKAGLEDNVFVGGKLGFGFGEFVELRAIYLQSLDLKTNFKDYGIVGYDESLFTPQDVTITRWGGEFKANFGTKGIKPYFTLGAGVQNIDPKDSGDFEQVYGSLGLGVKFNLTKRLVFALEAKNTTYQFNAGANLLSEDNKTVFGATDADFENERLSNWSAMGSFQFYLGGRKPGTLSDLDKAYLQNFKGGFKGLQWVIEPSLAYVDFADESLFRDTYWLGGYAGLDLNEYIGIRAFYFHATQNDELSTDFDKIAMYGGEFRARLNDGNGVTPFLILGGGYLNPSDNYVPLANQDGTFSTVDGGEFATGGLGLNIPLGKHVLITGGARAMLTSGENVTDITNTDDIQTHIFYNAGIKFSLGKKSKAPSMVYQENLERELTAQQQVNNTKIENFKQEYQSKVESLEKDLKQAYEAKDVEKAVEILEEKKQVEKALDEVKEIEKVQKEEIKLVAPSAKETGSKKTKATAIDNTVGSEKLIRMTPQEFESLIDRILKNLGEGPQASNKKSQADSLQVNTSNIKDQQIQQLNDRVVLLEKLLMQLNNAQNDELTDPDNPNVVQHSDAKVNGLNTVILERLDELNKKIDTNSNQIQSNKKGNKTLKEEPNQSDDYDHEGMNLEEDFMVSDTLVNESLLKYKNSSAILGFNYGGASTGNIGLRSHFSITKTKLEFMPEAYIGFGESNTWAVSGNVIYPIAIGSEKFMPYAGAGLGFGNLIDETTGFYNVVIGTKLPVLHENLYVDYTMRNSFDFNQIAVGYSLKF